MYLHIGDYTKAMENFNVLLQYSEADDSKIRFGVDDNFANNKWKNLFSDVQPFEHIYTLWFGNSSMSFQRNSLQSFFSAIAPNQYAIKPTKKAVELWETIWKNKNIGINADNP